MDQPVEFEYEIKSFDKQNKHVTVQIFCNRFSKERRLRYNISLNGLTNKDEVNELISNHCRSIVENILLSETPETNDQIEEFIEQSKNKPFKVSVNYNKETDQKANTLKTLSVPRETKITNPKSFEIIT